MSRGRPMTTLSTTLCLLAITWVIHVALWRFRLPRNQTRALLFLFTLVLGVWLIFLAPRLGLVETLQVMTLSIPLFLCYVITYSAIEGDSPTLSLMKHLDERRHTGLHKDEVFLFFLARPFLQARIDALVKSGLIKLEGERFVIAKKPSLSFKVVLEFRKLFGPISKGG